MYIIGVCTLYIYNVLGVVFSSMMLHTAMSILPTKHMIIHIVYNMVDMIIHIVYNMVYMIIVI